MVHTTIVQLDKADELYWMHRLARFPDLADKVLTDFDDVCNELDIPHFIHAGTALGFYRDNKYTVTALDLDCGVIVSKDQMVEFRKKKNCCHPLQLKLIEKGFTCGSEGYLRNTHYYRDNICLDVHWEFESWNLQFFEVFDNLVYKDRSYNIPSPIIQYLEEMYGSNWRVPDDWGIPHLCPTCRGK